MKKSLFGLFSLLVLALSSCSNDDTTTPAPSAQPVASFTVSTNGCVGTCTATFTNTSQNATTYSWDFGDGTNVSTVANPTHVYAAPGTYTVTLIATGTAGSHLTTQSIVIGTGTNPMASFTIANDGCVGPCTVSFTNTSQNATSYSWNFGDGTAASTATSPTHSYTTAGTYTVLLTATGAGGTDTTSQTVTINSTAGPTFYITYKVDGVQVNLTNVEGVRAGTAPNRTLVVQGTMAGGANPKFKFHTTESFIGFVAGLNVGTDENSMPTEYSEHTNAGGTLFGSANDPDGVDFFFQELSFTNGGVARGTFSGKMKSATGTQINITNGTFRVKFSN